MCASTIGRMARLGVVEAVSDGERWWIDPVDLDRYQREEARWITWVEAADVIGCNRHVVESLVRAGTLTTRQAPRPKPSILREDAEAYRPVWEAQQADRRRQRAARTRAAAVRDALRQPPDGSGAWLTPTEAAERLGMSRQGVQNRINQGRLPATQIGRRWWVRSDHVEIVLNAEAFHHDRRLADSTSGRK